MADDADVPLHAAGNPGVAQSQVAGLEDGVYMQQLPSRLLVIEGPEPSAQFRQEGSLQEFVLQDKCLEGMITAGPVIAVLDGVRQDGIHPSPSHVPGFLPVYGGLVDLYLCMGVRH